MLYTQSTLEGKRMYEKCCLRDVTSGSSVSSTTIFCGAAVMLELWMVNHVFESS